MKPDQKATGRTVLAAAMSVTIATAPMLAPVALGDSAIATNEHVLDNGTGSEKDQRDPTSGNNNGNSDTGSNSGDPDKTRTSSGSVDDDDTDKTRTSSGSVDDTSSSPSPSSSYYPSASDTSGTSSPSSVPNYYDLTSSYYYDDYDTTSTSSSSSSSSSSTSSTSGTTTSATPKSTNWTRKGGSDRYETMSQIVSAGWTSSDWAVVATGAAFPDALTASSLAGVRDCPVLLTAGDTLSPQAKSQIERLGVKDVYVVGGEGAVSSAVEAQLTALGVQIHRVAGTDRVSTSIQTYKEARAAGSASDCVIIATGDAFADALSIGAWSYSSKTPILLCRGGQLNDEAVAAIKEDSLVKRVVIVGGEAAVSESVKTQLGDGYAYERLAGDNRYATNASVATWALGHGLTVNKACVATGANFPDALAGAALTGKLQGSLLLEDGSGNAARWLNERGAKPTNSFVLGGVNAVSEAAMAALK